MGKAIAYTSGLWSGLGRFLEDPKIPLDTNGVERALRGVAAALGAVALVLDREPGDSITFWEEWLEMNGALALLFAAALAPATLHQEPRAQLAGLAHSRRFRLAFFACLAVATLCGVLFV